MRALHCKTHSTSSEGNNFDVAATLLQEMRQYFCLQIKVVPRSFALRAKDFFYSYLLLDEMMCRRIEGNHMAKKKEFVEHITSQQEDFSRWYTDVIMNADMVDYSEIKGCMVIKPYGYGIWELIQKELDRRFKETGHKNAYFPMLIPESLLMKEAEHVEGFAPEVAWVTQGGGEPLQERLAIRPTSETIICSMYSKWVQSYRDLPLLLNQWCSVLRWEKTTRPFLRTSEFLWQEGHTVHETQEEAEEETMRMIHVYKEFAENVLAIPVIAGQKSEKEKFAGADHTYTMEAMMLDGRALQMGTSHNLGQNFAKGFDIQYLSREGKREYAWQTSWGVSTRMIGGIIMVHGDDRGLKLPPKVAPIQCMVIPVAAHKPGITQKARDLKDLLSAAGIRTEIDEREQSVGWKFNECELRGIPVRIEIGPKDLEQQQVVAVRRDTLEKKVLSWDALPEAIEKLLKDIHQNMFNMAKEYRDKKIYYARNFEEFKQGIEEGKGFVKAPWCGETDCELEIKAETGATTRCMPLDEHDTIKGVCVHCGKPAKKIMYFGKSY